MHVALARKYRPRLFGELIAQDHVARALRGAVQQGRVAHGYVFAGPRGVGKTTAARILAMALNCDARHAGAPTAAPGEPCGECVSCRRIWSGSTSLDVVEIDAASNRGVDDARELRERAMYAASQEGRFKVYIVDEAHMLTREAWNTLLKILEEPPPGVVFVFATTEPHKITNTAAPVMSRLQRFDFRRVGPRAIAERLREVADAERVEADEDAVELIARVANGGVRDALSILEQVTTFGSGVVSAARVRDVLGLVGDEVYAELFSLVIERRPREVFPFVAKLVDAGVDLAAFAEGAGDLWRAALAARVGAAPDGVSAALAAEVVRRSGELAPGDLLRILRALAEAEEPIRRGGAPRLALETLLLRWALMDRTVDIAELVKAVGAHRDARATEEAEPTSPPRALSDRSPASPGPRGPEASEPARPSARRSGPLTLDALRELWPEIVVAARTGKKMLVAEALADALPDSLEGDALALRPLGGSPLTAEGLGRHRAAVEAVIARVAGAPLRVTVASADPEPSRAAVAKPRRASPGDAKAERTRALRARDPALDRAIDALDLELLE
ncbi:MAG: DNA polymerase III subunit gamma/tau [Gemmatimonadetes bacterium]|nr:DNA polymerase III subunit gamma/tau [Gemmatimonadota bacterium]